MELSKEFPVAVLCRLMNVNRSGFYKWKKRLEHPSKRLLSFVSDLALFKEYHAKYPSHGYRWLNAKIRLDTGLKMILSILVDTFISKISLPMQPVPEIRSISGA